MKNYIMEIFNYLQKNIFYIHVQDCSNNSKNHIFKRTIIKYETINKFVPIPI